MLKGDVVMNPSQEDWDCIRGYTSKVNCPICTCDILVKTGVVEKVIWALCHVCFDKGWTVPGVSEDSCSLIYFNSRTGRIKMIRIFT